MNPLKFVTNTAITMVACFGLVSAGIWLDPVSFAKASDIEITTEYVKIRNSTVQVEKSDATGSGWAVSSRGDIITCAHVVGDETRVIVTFRDVNDTKIGRAHV